MKRFLIISLFLSIGLNAQNYVDLFKIGYGQTFNNDFDGTPNSTYLKVFDASLTIPIVLNENHAFITGADFTTNELQLFPEIDFTNLYSSTLKLGMASTWNEKWSTTIVLLPKVASDYKDISSEDFYFGGFALLKLKKRENLIYRFGFYGSTEAFGFFTTPIIGWYYLSPNGRFEMDMSLPVQADMNYCLGATTIGLDYVGIGRSFNVESDGPPIYVDLSSLEFASYLQFNTLGKSVLLRAKFGYSSNDYEVYERGEKIDLGLSAFSFGDDRTQINPSISGGFFLKFEAIYRFNLKNDKEEFDSPTD